MRMINLTKRGWLGVGVGGGGVRSFSSPSSSYFSLVFSVFVLFFDIFLRLLPLFPFLLILRISLFLFFLIFVFSFFLFLFCCSVFLYYSFSSQSPSYPPSFSSLGFLLGGKEWRKGSGTFIDEENILKDRFPLVLEIKFRNSLCSNIRLCIVKGWVL